jgi:hypothetical protein
MLFVLHVLRELCVQWLLCVRCEYDLRVLCWFAFESYTHKSYVQDCTNTHTHRVATALGVFCTHEGEHIPTHIFTELCKDTALYEKEMVHIYSTY